MFRSGLNARKIAGRRGSSSPSASRSSPRHGLKRQKLGHLELEERMGSKCFPPKESYTTPTCPNQGPNRPVYIYNFSSQPRHRRPYGIVIEDDTPTTEDDDPHEPIGLTDAFDRNRPSSILSLRSFLEKRQKLPQGGDSASARRVPKTILGDGRMSTSCTDGDGDDVQPGRPPSTSRLTARAGMSSRGNNVKSGFLWIGKAS